MIFLQLYVDSIQDQSLINRHACQQHDGWELQSQVTVDHQQCNLSQ